MFRSAPVILSLALASSAAAQVDFGAVKYQKLATRAETEQRMVNLLQNRPDLRWGEWYLLTPFAGNEKGTLDRVLPPEAELAKMNVDGPGPDLTAKYVGKLDTEATWRKMGFIEDRPIDLKVHQDDRLNNRGNCYLYRTVSADRDGELDVHMGSDDGLKFWMNGKVLITADVPRGLDPDAHQFKLQFKKGVNHIFVKVAQGAGGWELQMNTRAPLDAMNDAKLQYQLDKDFPVGESEYYRVSTIPIPENIVLEVGGLDALPDGRPVVCTRRGDIYIIGGATEEPPFNPKFTLFATGLHEPLGLAVRVEDGKPAVYCVQRGELTKMIDLDGDDRADTYRTVCDGWGLSGNYHEFAFGPKFDRDGNAWVTLNVGFCGGLGKSVVPWRGWALKILTGPGGDNSIVPICDGLRSPNGIGMNLAGDMFYADNQGDYVGTNKISFLAKDSYQGHPAGLRWRKDGEAAVANPPTDRMHPAIWLPYKKMGQSVADILLDDTGGKFGPFTGQIFSGDQTLATVNRIEIENVEGTYQGAAFPFRAGFDCGLNRLCWDKQGGMFVGETDRGWGSVGRRRFGVQRIVWTGVVPFEVLSMRAAPDGFVLTFTEPPTTATVSDLKSYTMSSFTYKYHADYGSPEIETKPVVISKVEVLSPTKVHLVVEGLRQGGEGYVHELKLPGIKNAAGKPLVHAEAYYTLHKIPAVMPADPRADAR